MRFLTAHRELSPIRMGAHYEHHEFLLRNVHLRDKPALNNKLICFTVVARLLFCHPALPHNAEILFRLYPVRSLSKQVLLSPGFH